MEVSLVLYENTNYTFFSQITSVSYKNNYAKSSLDSSQYLVQFMFSKVKHLITEDILYSYFVKN